MSPTWHAEGANREPRTVGVRGERFELLDHLQAVLEPIMAALGLVFLGLLLLDYASVGLSRIGQARLDRALQIIWAIFLIDFGVRLAVAPAKRSFLRRNWLTALSLALPFLRPLRVFRAARALRSLSLARLLGGLNRGMRVLRQVARGRQFAYVGLLTVVVVLAGAVGVLSFDRGIAGAPIQTMGDALWWSAAMVTTINNEKYAVSAEARTIAVLQRIYAVSVFGFVTASIASYFIGTTRTTSTAADDVGALRAEIAALREELALIQRSPTAMTDLGSWRGSDAPATVRGEGIEEGRDQ